MHRMGALPDELEAMVEALSEPPESRLRLEGVWTQFAVADAPDDPFTAEQLRRGSILRLAQLRARRA